MNRDLMTYVNVKIRDRTAGQPASPESIERDQQLSAKAVEIAKLRALRLAAALAPSETPPKKQRRKHS